MGCGFDVDRYLGYEFVVVGQMRPAVDTAVGAVALIGQIGLECFHHRVPLLRWGLGRAGLPHTLCHLGTPSKRTAFTMNAASVSVYGRSAETRMRAPVTSPRGVGLRAA